MTDQNSASASAAKPTDDETTAAFQAAATAADTRTAAAVSTLTLIQQARLTNQKRTAALATAVYGASSSQATAAQKTVTSTTTAAARLAMLTQQANTAAPTVPASGWVFHGRVYSSDLTAQSAYAVYFVDAQKKYVADYGYSYTDDTGYFNISSSGTTARAVQAQPSESQSSENQAGASQSTQSQACANQTAAPELYLQIADTKGNPVLLSQTAFVPTTGKATYQSITLPAGDKKLGDLPADIRAAVLPDLTKQKAAASNTATTDQTKSDQASPDKTT